jgi:hypothetical protein
MNRTALAWVACLALGCGAGASRPEAAAPAPAASACGAGVEVAADLDGDGRDDRVILAPSADAVLCLEIVTTAAPPLVCRGDAAPEVAVLEFDLDGIEEAGTTPCDPSGAAITVWSGADAPRSPPQVPASAAPAIPTGRALVLLGGDAAAVLAWQGPGQRWAWVPLGY